MKFIDLFNKKFNLLKKENFNYQCSYFWATMGVISLILIAIYCIGYVLFAGLAIHYITFNDMQGGNDADRFTDRFLLILIDVLLINLYFYFKNEKYSNFFDSMVLKIFSFYTTCCDNTLTFFVSIVQKILNKYCKKL